MPKIKIGNLMKDINEAILSEGFFDVDFDGVTIAVNNTDGEYSVYDAVNGLGQKCYDEYRNHQVEIIPDETN